MASTPVALGASAAVNAIVMLQVMLYPREMIYIYMVLPIPAAAFGLLYIVGDMFGMLGVRQSHISHICLSAMLSCLFVGMLANTYMFGTCMHVICHWSLIVFHCMLLRDASELLVDRIPGSRCIHH